MTGRTLVPRLRQHQARSLLPLPALTFLTSWGCTRGSSSICRGVASGGAQGTPHPGEVPPPLPAGRDACGVHLPPPRTLTLGRELRPGGVRRRHTDEE